MLKRSYGRTAGEASTAIAWCMMPDQVAKKSNVGAYTESANQRKESPRPALVTLARDAWPGQLDTSSLDTARKKFRYFALLEAYARSIFLILLSAVAFESTLRQTHGTFHVYAVRSVTLND